MDTVVTPPEEEAPDDHRTKTVLTEVGAVQVDVPRDRDVTFEPKIIATRLARLSGFDQLVISLSAKRMTALGCSEQSGMRSRGYVRA